MTTITIDDKKIGEKYNEYELKLKIINFLQDELNIDDIEFFSVNIENLDENIKKAYKKSFDDVFIDY